MSDPFENLIDLVEEDEVDEIIEQCEKMLSSNATDKDVLRLLGIAQMQDSDFDAAQRTLDRSPTSTPFERAYCKYRKYKINESLDELEKADDDEATAHLRAQNNYRLGNFDKAVEIYEKYLDPAEMDNEQQTNALAAYANAGSPIKALKFVTRLHSSENDTEMTHELLYNTACVLIDCGELKKASAKLDQAMKLCKETLQEEEATEDEIVNELGVIRAQKAYILQREGKKEQALKLYLDVLSDKPNAAVMAVCCNNIISLRRQDEKLFDSLKKSTRAASVDKNKLTVRQNRAIALNRCLLHLYGHKGDQCREEVSKLQSEMPSSEMPVLVLASHYFKENKTDKCNAVLDEHIKAHPNSCVQTRLTKAQMLLSDGNVDGAITALMGLEAELRYRPAVVASVVQLAIRLKQVDRAAQLLNEAVQFWNGANDTNIPKETVKKFARILTQACADFHLQHGLYSKAAPLYEVLAKQSKSPEERRSYIAQLVRALAPIDPQKAAVHAQSLPAVECGSVVIEDLEAVTRGRVDVKRKIRGELKLRPSAVEDEEKRAKRRKKRKPRYPKNFDPNNPGPPPDPERWLPRWERSNAKKQRKRGQRGAAGIARGPQGGGASMETSRLDASENLDVTAVQAKTTKSQSASQRAQARKKKGKKRR